MKTRVLFIILIGIAVAICVTVGVMVAGGHVPGHRDYAVDPTLRIDWTVTQQDEGDLVTVKVYLVCSEIAVGARKDGTLTIEGQRKKFKTPAIEMTEKGPHEVLLAEHSAVLARASDKDTVCHVEAAWKINCDVQGEDTVALYAKKTLQIGKNGVTVDITGTEPAETDSYGAESTGESDVPPATEPSTEDVTDPVVTDPPATEPNTEGETEPVTESPETAPDTTPATEEPVDGLTEESRYTVKSSSGTYIDLVCEVVVSVAPDGQRYATATLYYDHYSLYSEAKTGGTFHFGGKETTYGVPAISVSEEIKHHRELVSLTVPCQKGQTLTVKAFMPYNGSYAGVVVNNLTIDTVVTVE